MTPPGEGKPRIAQRGTVATELEAMGYICGQPQDMANDTEDGGSLLWPYSPWG